MPSLTDIATTIRKHSPGVLPEGFVVDDCFGIIIKPSCEHLPDSIAEAVLRDAMVRDANLGRWHAGRWEATRGSPHSGFDAHEIFHDAAHGGSLGACYAAWCWSKGIA